MTLLLLSMACLGISQFEKRYATEFCTYAKECEVLDLEGFSTMGACESEAEILPDDCDEFDQKKGRQCLDELALMDCRSGQSGPPAICATVCN